MTNFKVKYKNGKFDIKCVNHAIPDVCRGVSAIIYTLAQTLKIEHELKRDKELVMDLKPGSAIISIKPKRKFYKRTELIIRTCVFGLMCIQKAYPKEITIQADCVLNNL